LEVEVGEDQVLLEGRQDIDGGCPTTDIGGALHAALAWRIRLRSGYSSAQKFFASPQMLVSDQITACRGIGSGEWTLDCFL
jgi:hypothetical protein